MKLSIITTSFNSEKYIEETIESVIYQRGDFDLEYILIDGGSTDKTNEIIQKYYNKWQRNELEIKCNSLTMKYISEPDKGMYDGIAKGFAMISDNTDIIAYINSDDFYLPNAFKTVTDVFKDLEQVCWLTGRATIYLSPGYIVSNFGDYPFYKKYIRKGFYGNIFPHIQQESTFWRKSLLDSVDLDKFRTFKYAGDFYLWYCFAKNHNLYRLKAQISGFRINEGQLSENMEIYKKEFDSIKDKSSLLDRLTANLLNKYISIKSISKIELDEYSMKNFIFFSSYYNKWIAKTARDDTTICGFAFKTKNNKYSFRLSTKGFYFEKGILN